MEHQQSPLYTAASTEGLLTSSEGRRRFWALSWFSGLHKVASQALVATSGCAGAILGSRSTLSEEGIISSF